MKGIFTAILMICITSLCFAQSVEFKVSAPSVVEVGEQFSISYVLNKKGKNLKLPEIKGLRLLMGPSVSQSSYYNNINGKVSQGTNYTYSYVFQATKEGNVSVGKASISIEGKEYTSNTTEMEVIGGDVANTANLEKTKGVNDRKNNNSSQKLFLRVETNKKSAFIGEPISATIKIYTNVDIVRFGQSKFPSFNGFLSEEIPTSNTIEFKREALNGNVYNVGVLRKLLLFPQHKGEVIIDPFELEVVIREQSRGGGSGFFDDFFGNYTQKTLYKSSKPIKINVKALPEEGKPLGFSGSVGNIRLKTSISHDTITANEAITYKVEFRGSGNLKLMNAPELNLPADFESYEPKETKNVKLVNNRMEGVVTYEYIVIPRFGGDYKIPRIEYSYFDIKSKSYKTLKGEDYNIHVLKSKNSGNNQIINPVQSYKKEDIKVLGEDIRFINTSNTSLYETGSKFFGTLKYWLWFIVPLFIFIVGIIVNRRRIKANADTVRLKNKSANKMAKKRLRLAANALKNNNSDLFYDEILKALWGYVSYKLNIDKSKLNRDNISDVLKTKNIEEINISKFIELLDSCEFARYAPSGNQDKEMHKIYEESLSTITDLDKSINKKS